MCDPVLRTFRSAALLSALALAAACSGTGGAPWSPPGVDAVRVERRVAAADPRPTREGVRGWWRSPRVLCVTAHPDDEIAFAGVVYKTVTHLGGRVDLCVLTDGQGGFKYSTLAEPVYGVELTDEGVGRARLPAIRRAELAAGCAWLGFDTIYHLDERDHRYTQEVAEVLGPERDVWDVGRIRRALRALLEHQDYDVVLVLAPTPATHAHHKAASLLAAAAVADLPGTAPPAVLCVEGWRATDAAGEPGPAPTVFPGLAGWPESRPHDGPPLVFDRRQPLGFRGRLDYSIVANWAIAEHKSQGTMQLLSSVGDREVYTVLAVTPEERLEGLRAWFDALAEPQFEAKSYDASAGTNALAPDPPEPSRAGR